MNHLLLGSQLNLQRHVGLWALQAHVYLTVDKFQFTVARSGATGFQDSIHSTYGWSCSCFGPSCLVAWGREARIEPSTMPATAIDHGNCKWCKLINQDVLFCFDLWYQAFTEAIRYKLCLVGKFAGMAQYIAPHISPFTDMEATTVGAAEGGTTGAAFIMTDAEIGGAEYI